MLSEYYSPHSEALRPFFGMKSRIDSREKSFIFILGVLVGALLQCRLYHDNNDASHGLPISQLLTIYGDNLWTLYDKVMSELSDPGNACDKVEGVVVEARHLYASLSRQISMDEATTTYFILYGISASSSICHHPCKWEKV